MHKKPAASSRALAAFRVASTAGRKGIIRNLELAQAGTVARRIAGAGGAPSIRPNPARPYIARSIINSANTKGKYVIDAKSSCRASELERLPAMRTP